MCPLFSHGNITVKHISKKQNLKNSSHLLECLQMQKCRSISLFCTVQNFRGVKVKKFGFNSKKQF